jgi:hypothetical protein
LELIRGGFTFREANRGLANSPDGTVGGAIKWLLGDDIVTWTTTGKNNSSSAIHRGVDGDDITREPERQPKLDIGSWRDKKI